MLRIAALVTLLAAFPAVGLAARRADTPATANTVAKVVSCDVTSSDRSATFFARMDTVPGASKLQIRFQLLERLGRGAEFNRLDLPALRQWHSSAAGVSRYAWKQTVDGLHVGGAYKTHVTYRWLTAAGTVLQTMQRDTSVCRGPLPNIEVGDLSVRPGPTSDTRVYRVNVADTGKIGADGVDVQMAVDNAELDTVTVSHLDAGESRVVSFTGPVCSHAIEVNVDPDNSIGESVEGDNSQQFACP
jgi:hypothetical protein